MFISKFVQSVILQRKFSLPGIARKSRSCSKYFFSLSNFYEKCRIKYCVLRAVIENETERKKQKLMLYLNLLKQIEKVSFEICFSG